MKIDFDKNMDEIMLIPETDFEKEFIDRFCQHGSNLTVFKKCGITPSDVVGLKIKKEDKENE